MRRNLPAHVHRRHPILTQEYAAFTPPIAEMAEKIGDWIDQRQGGGYIYGPSRWGKSRGVKWHVKASLEERFGSRVPLHIWSRPPDSQRSEGEFWRSMQVAFGQRYGSSRTMRGDRRDALRKFLVASAELCDSNVVVVICDEMQDASLVEWKWLLGLHNHLDQDGYRLSVFSIATHQMGYDYELLARSGFAHVAARFMVAHWEFPGIRSAQELEFVFRGYDEASDWPSGSGISYTAHFAPDAFRRGERLCSSAKTAWTVLNALLPDDYRGDASFPMKYVALAAEEVLYRVACGEDWDEVTCENSWLEILGATGFTDHMRLISAALLTRRGSTKR